MVSHNLVLNSFPLRFFSLPFSSTFKCLSASLFQSFDVCVMVSVALVDGQRHSPSFPSFQKEGGNKKISTKKR